MSARSKVSGGDKGRRSSVKIAVHLGMTAAALPFATVVQAQPEAAATTFAAMKRFVGTWRVADKPTSPLRVRFDLTAGGTVLVESWERSGRPYSLTLYHRDGASLIATHYCPQGNQPRLGLTPDSTIGSIRFVFRDSTDLDAEHEGHLVALSFDLSDPKVLVRRESYREHGVDSPAELKLVRDGDTPG